MSPLLLGLVAADAPLDPSPDRAEDLFRRELLRPEYHDQNPLQQFLDWLGRRFESGIDQASQASPLGGLGALLVFLALLVLIGWVVSRARTAAKAPGETGAVLTAERITAAELRARAAAALAAGDTAAAVVDGYRALTLHQIERARIEDQPGATAHEVAVRLGDVFAGSRPRIQQAADLFDLVLYGDRPATRAQAEAVLALDHELAGPVAGR